VPEHLLEPWSLLDEGAPPPHTDDTALLPF